MGSRHDNPEHRCYASERPPQCERPSNERPAKVRRPRARLCLRKGCERKYQPQCPNQRYCQDPVCLREVRRWQAARRQASRRKDPRVQAEHAAAERVRRERAKAASQPAKREEVTTARGHAAKVFFQNSSAIGRGATNRRPTRSVTRRASAAPAVARLCAMSWIVNGSGNPAIR